MQITRLLDGLEPERFSGVFTDNLKLLEQYHGLQGYRVLDGRVLITLDGVWHISSGTILMNHVSFDDKAFIHSFEHYDSEHKVTLRGISRIITIELAKLDEVVEKSVAEMSSQERWSVFFRFLRDIRQRGKINKILSQKEGIAMAGAVIQTISRDHEERLRLITEYKNIMDWQSGMVEARREGIAEGRIATAKNLLTDGMEPERVAQYTGLSLDNVLKLWQDK